MRDEEDGHALLAEARHDAEQLSDLVGRQGSRGLVHDEHTHVERQGLDDLDGLLLSQGQAPSGLHHVHVDVQPGKDLLCLLAHLAAIDEAPPVTVADEDVLGDGQVGKDHRFLIDGRHGVGLRVEGAADVDGLPVDEDVADIGLDDAGHDLDQGGLARAILAQERIDLAGHQLERDIVEGLDLTEALGDPTHLKDRIKLGRILLGSGLLHVILGRARLLRGLLLWLGHQRRIAESGGEREES